MNELEGYTRQIILIPTERGDGTSLGLQPVIAAVYGSLAWHYPAIFSSSQMSSLVSVTHIPTGHAILWTEAPQQARGAIKMLLDSGIDWSFDDIRKAPKGTREVVAAAKEKCDFEHATHVDEEE